MGVRLASALAFGSINLTAELSIGLLGLREPEARARLVGMDNAGVQFTGFSCRGDEREGERLPHVQGARDTREIQAGIGQVLGQPEPPVPLGIHIVDS